jgi:Transcriptional regulator
MPRRSREEITAAIQDAAIRLFATRGYQEITMVEVAQKAHIAKRTLYKYYPSKIALFASIFERYLQMLLREMRAEEYDGLSFGEILKKSLTFLYDFTKKNEGFMRLFWMINNESVEGDVPEELKQQINRWNMELVDQTADFLREKQPNGLFRGYSPELVTHMISAVNKGIFLQITKESSLGIPGPVYDDLLNLFCDMILYCDH